MLINTITEFHLAISAYEWALSNNGAVPSEFGYGVYQMADGLCHAAESEIGAVISGYVNVTSTVDAVLTAIQVNGPLAVAIDAAHIVCFLVIIISMIFIDLGQEFVFYTSGVYYNPACGNTDADLDHEVLAVGFGTDPVVSVQMDVTNGAEMNLLGRRLLDREEQLVAELG